MGQSLKVHGWSLLLSLASSVLFFAGYFSAWWPCIILAPVPLSLAILLAPSARAAALWAVIGGFLIWRPLLHPLAEYGQEGVALLSLWQALTLIPMALGLWWGHRLKCSLLWLFPVFWIGAEWMRMNGPTGFPFGSLALPCHDQRWMIQIADIGGLHLLSFALCLPGAFLLQWVMEGKRTLRRTGRQLAPVLAAWILIALYGVFRIRQMEGEMRPGPVVAVIQPDVPFIRGAVSSYDPMTLLKELMTQSEEAARQSPPPDLIVWPENIMTIPLKNPEFLDQPFDLRMVPESVADDPGAIRALEERWNARQASYRRFADGFQDWTRSLGIPVLVGTKATVPAAAASEVPFHDYNCARLYRPESGSIAERQYKMRLFPFGEYLPGEAHPFWETVYQWPVLKPMAARSAHITPGRMRKVITLDSKARFAVGICSEVLYPESSGVFLKGGDDEKAIHFMVSIANEGAFMRNRALLVTYYALPFRAVEGRMAIARSANTGISCFIDPTGRAYGHVVNEQGDFWTGIGVPEADTIERLLETRNSVDAESLQDPQWVAQVRGQIEAVERMRKEAGVSGHSVAPLYLVDRVTFYHRWGNWLAWLLFIGWLAPAIKWGLSRKSRAARASPGIIMQAE